MSFKYKTLLSIVPVVVFLDQLTKLWIVHALPIGAHVPVIPGFFDIVHVRNSGAAFGMMASWPDAFRIPFFYGITVIAIIILIVLFRSIRKSDRLLALAVPLIFSGVIGNVIDRIHLGSVVDFLSFHISDTVLDLSSIGMDVMVPLVWPAFNVADSAITVSLGLLLFSGVWLVPDNKKTH